jgi:DNA polymerase-4
VTAAQRPIVFVEVPAFYAAVERAADPALRDRPVVVGGDPRKRGQVQSASPDALAAGVEIGMAMLEALERCPRAKAVRTDMKRYREAAGLLRALLRRHTERIEPVGLDAAFLDPSSSIEEARELAGRLCHEIREELQLTARVGIACVKFLARVAAGRAEPGGVLEVPTGGEAAFLAPLPASVLPGVGPKTDAALRELGVEHLADLQRLTRAQLEQALGNHGLRILELASGEDPQPVRAAPAPRTLSQEHTFEVEQLDLGVFAECLQRLASGLETALRRQGLGARRVAVKVRYADHETATRSQTLPHAVRGAAEIFEVAERLLERTQAGIRSARGLGISLAGLGPSSDDERQLDLFGR